MALRFPARAIDPGAVADAIMACSVGCETEGWEPPRFLWTHQLRAATRVVGALECCGGALLADQVGLGKTYVALAVATRYDRVTVVCPASLRSQWAATAQRLSVSVTIVSHEKLSRRAEVPEASLIVVDEAHRFRNPSTVRYDQLARGCGAADLLLVTATPIVNRIADLVALLELIFPENGLAAFGLGRFSYDTAASDLMPAVAPIMVSRTSSCLELDLSLPGAEDESRWVAAVPHQSEQKMLRLITGLAFPNFGAREAAALLRKHLCMRLASSVPALRESIGRHLKYIDLCLNSQPVPRGGAVLQLLGPSNELQLDFLHVLAGPRGQVDEEALKRERTTLRRARALLDTCTRDPKAETLRSLLEKRSGRKTLVYVGASTTAFHLATTLGWVRTAVVTGRGSRIASGAVRTDEALDLFAPRARRMRSPGPSQVVDVMIATDLASEGLDLQDADAIVHYDLPWNPIRLTQRLGRIRRLGTRHEQLEVFWFRPSPDVGRFLGIEQLIARKSSDHVVPISTASAIAGRSIVVGRTMEARELMCAHTKPAGRSGFCVVSGTSDAAFGLRWHTSRAGCFTETVVFRDGRLLRDPAIALRTIRRLAGSRPSDGTCLPTAFDSLRSYIKKRFRIAGTGPTRDFRLSRRIMRRGRAAAGRRDCASLQTFDTLLDALNSGVSVGAKRRIDSWLNDASFDVLASLRIRYGAGSLCDVEVVGAIVGDAGTAGPLNRLIK